MSEPAPYSEVMSHSIQSLAADYHCQISLCPGGISIVYWAWEDGCARRAMFHSAEAASAWLLKYFKEYEGPDETPAEAQVSDITGKRGRA